MRRGGVLPRPKLFLSFFAPGGLLSFPGEKREFCACGRGSLLAIPYFASGGLFSFNSERKEEKKRRQKLRFWISLRAFARYLSRLFLAREQSAHQFSPKYCIVSASLFAAAFALKCRRTSFYRGRNQRQRRRRRDSPFARATKKIFRDRAAQTADKLRA